MRSSATTKATWSKLKISNSEAPELKQNIALTGFMAVGKSAVGRSLARRLKRRFVDLDRLIEKNEGVKIREIFLDKGEPYFREVEKQVLQDVLRQDGQVIATGGGVVTDKENLRLLREKSFLICLSASTEILLRRAGSGKKRPLLKGSDKARGIEELLTQRKKHYDQAHATIDTSELSVEQVVERILALLETAS